MSINIKEETGSVQTVEEFEAVLKKFKEKYPAKYAIREAAGEFTKFKRTLIGYNPNKDPEVLAARQLAEEKAEAEAKEKAKVDALNKANARK